MVVFNYATRELTTKIVYYGPGLCGKTTNLQFIYDHMPQGTRGKMLSLATKSDRTLFFDFLPIDLGQIQGMKTKVQLYTVPGQVFYNETRRLVLKGADGVVFVADSQENMVDANIESFNNLEENLEAHGLKLAETPHVLQFNKQDLPGALPVEVLNERLNRYNAPFYEAIATTGVGVQETLRHITKLVLLRLNEKYGAEQQQPAARRAPSPAPAVSPRPAPAPMAEMPTIAAEIHPPAAPPRVAPAPATPAFSLDSHFAAPAEPAPPAAPAPPPIAAEPPAPARWTPPAPTPLEDAGGGFDFDLTETPADLPPAPAAAAPKPAVAAAAPAASLDEDDILGLGMPSVGATQKIDRGELEAFLSPGGKAIPPRAAPGLALAAATAVEVAPDDPLHKEPDLEVTRLAPGAPQEILIPLVLDAPSGPRHYRLVLRLEVQ